MIIKIFIITALVVLSHVLLHIFHCQTLPYYIGMIIGAVMMGIMIISNEDINLL